MPYIWPLGNSKFHCNSQRKNFELYDFTWTLFFFLGVPLVKQNLNQSSHTPRIAKKCNVTNKMSWFPQSEAFARSQTIPPTCFFFFWWIDLNTLSFSLKAASSVDAPFLKPFCSVTSMLLVFRWWLNLMCIPLSGALEKMVNNDTGL